MKVKQNSVLNMPLLPLMPAKVAVLTGQILWCAEGFQQNADLKIFEIISNLTCSLLKE